VAQEMKADFCDSIPECAKTYKAEAWEQFMMLAAAWLYLATEVPDFKAVRTAFCIRSLRHICIHVSAPLLKALRNGHCPHAFRLTKCAEHA
jgi:hypothetical protein